MEDAPSSSFQDFDLLMERLGLGSSSSSDQVDGGPENESDKRREREEEQTPVTWRERDSERLREYLNKSDDTTSSTGTADTSSTWRENRSQVTPEVGKAIIIRIPITKYGLI